MNSIFFNNIDSLPTKRFVGIAGTSFSMFIQTIVASAEYQKSENN